MKSFVTAVSFAVAVLTMNSSVACPDSSLKVNDVSLDSNGVITRRVTTIKANDNQNANAESTPKFKVAVRDSIKIEKGDEIVLNAGLQMVDASSFVKIKLKEQDRDAKGILSTTYIIRETMISSFTGVEQKSEKTFLAKVVSNYLGNGVYSKSCGEVIKTEIGSETIDTSTRTRY